jgi:hypothetical protein
MPDPPKPIAAMLGYPEKIDRPFDYQPGSSGLIGCSQAS